MTYEEAKTMLEKHQAWARSESKRYSEAVDIAIECIEKSTWHRTAVEKPIIEKEYLCCKKRQTYRKADILHLRLEQ